MGVNNLVPAVHNVHFKNNFRSLAPLVKNLCFKEKSVCTQHRNFVKIGEGYFQKAAKFEQRRTNYFVKLRVIGHICMSHLSFTQLGLSKIIVLAFK